MRTRICALAELAGLLPTADAVAVGTWLTAATEFEDWAGRPGLRAELRGHLRSLTGEECADVVRRSRETTTHFAWCLRDEPGEEFSFWLHEYKPQRDWRLGYADSVHNHRYHFCTTILRGSYLHERYTAELDPAGLSISSASLLRAGVCVAGAVGTILSHEFHRIPQAADGTMTFLVKSRPVTNFSLSYDPLSRVSRRHVPVEERMGHLADRI